MKGPMVWNDREGAEKFSDAFPICRHVVDRAEDLKCSGSSHLHGPLGEGLGEGNLVACLSISQQQEFASQAQTD